MDHSLDILFQPIVKLVAATVLGAVVGLEREIHGRPAGLRTNALVCMASCLLIVVSRSGALFGLDRSSDFIVSVDPARMAAGIVTGIGFLGAGAILKVKDDMIRGLTTAACIWFVAAVGIAVGLGAYLLAVTATLLGLFLLVAVGRLERGLQESVYRTLVVEADLEKREAIESSLKALLASRRIALKETGYRVDIPSAEVSFSMVLQTRTGHNTADLVSETAGLEGVRRVSLS